MAGHGQKPEEEISEIDFGRAALAAFFAELPTHAPPVDMTNMPAPVLRVKCLSNTTIVEFRAYAPWAPYSGQYISFDAATIPAGDESASALAASA